MNGSPENQPTCFTQSWRHLSSNYPGRFVICGLMADGNHFFQAAGTMGRSESSRARVYVREGDRVRTDYSDPENPSGNPQKIIYTAMLSRGSWNVASNGRQTETVLDDLINRKLMAMALRRWKNEGPEADNTSRIVAAVDHSENSEESVLMGKIVRNPFDPDQSIYASYAMNVKPGNAFMVTTYEGNGTTAPFTSDPMPLDIFGSFEGICDEIWDCLNSENRVSLIGKEIERGSGRLKYVMMNARQRVTSGV